VCAPIAGTKCVNEAVLVMQVHSIYYMTATKSKNNEGELSQLSDICMYRLNFANL